MVASMTSKASEAGHRNPPQECPPTPPPPRRAPAFHPPPPPSSPPSFPPTPRTSSIFEEARGIHVIGMGGRRMSVGVENKEEVYSTKTALKLARVNLVVASILFLCQLVVAGCLCRPVVIMSGLWVSGLILAQAILGLRTARNFSHSLVVGHAWLSGLVSIAGLAATGYLVSGHLTLACVSTFHRPDHDSLVRLYVVEVVAVVASLPCLTGSIVSLMATVLSARAICPSKPKNEKPFVLYLPRWGEQDYGTAQQTVREDNTIRRGPPPPAMSPSPSPPPHHHHHHTTRRTSSPPPSYNQIAEESFA